MSSDCTLTLPLAPNVKRITDENSWLFDALLDSMVNHSVAAAITMHEIAIPYANQSLNDE